MQYLWYYLLIMNAAAFILMLADNRKAIRHKHRIPEAALMGMAILGGSAGALLGMRICRHKTKHPQFYLGLPAILILHLLLLFLLWR